MYEAVPVRHFLTHCVLDHLNVLKLFIEPQQRYARKIDRTRMRKLSIGLRNQKISNRIRGYVLDENAMHESLVWMYEVI